MWVIARACFPKLHTFDLEREFLEISFLASDGWNSTGGIRQRILLCVQRGIL